MARKPSVAASSKSASAPARILVLHGPEEMRKREALDQLRALLEAAFGQTDTVLFDGKAALLADVLDELRSLSLMQQYKIVLVDDADVFVTAHREPLERYAAAPVDSATLVLRSVKWNKGNLDKLIEKVGSVVKCESLAAREVPAWLTERARTTHQRKLEPRAAQFLAERLGGDLMMLDNELAKLALLAGEKDAITVAMVEQVVGRGSDEDAWAIQECLLAALADPSPRTIGKTVEMVHELVDLSGQPDILVSYFVADLMRKLQLGLLMRKQGMSEFEIGKEFRLWGPRQEAFARALRGLKEATAARLFDRIIRMDVRAKTGRGEAMRNLECFCAVLGDEIRQDAVVAG